jgi:putative YhbY family RNA-binding protein
MNEAPVRPPLPPKKLRELRAKAHALKPVVWISQNGVSEGAVREVDRALSAHELIKIHAALDDRLAREALLATLCRGLGADPVQVIGKTLIAFRPRPQEPVPTAQPGAGRAKLNKSQRGRAPSPPRPRTAAKRRVVGRRSKPAV